MSKPYLLVADLHLHSWSAFATTNADGLNSRLHIQLNELDRAAEELRKRGGRKMIVAGDTFHVRGSISPEVFNPVHVTFQRIAASGVSVEIIPGNHDLAGKETNELGNAVQTLSAIPNITVVTRTTAFGSKSSDMARVLVPWRGTLDGLRTEIKTVSERIRALPPGVNTPLDQYDLILHVGIDGVLIGVPNAGLSAGEVASWGFRRVFAGHYHHHKEACPGVYSIGASAHQTWSDIGSKAGFVFVYPDHIEWQASHAPEFVEITGEDDPDEIPLIVDGNYVRIRGMKLSDAEIKTFRTQLEEMGARGVSFQVAREAVVARTGATAGKATTLDESVDKFIDTLTEIDAPAVKAECTDVLSHIRSVAA